MASNKIEFIIIYHLLLFSVPRVRVCVTSNVKMLPRHVSQQWNRRYSRTFLLHHLTEALDTKPAQMSDSAH